MQLTVSRLTLRRRLSLKDQGAMEKHLSFSDCCHAPTPFEFFRWVSSHRRRITALSTQNSLFLYWCYYLLMIVFFSIQTTLSLLCPTLYWYLILTINFQDSIAQDDSEEGAGTLAKAVGLQAHDSQLRALGRGPPARGRVVPPKALSREGNE